MGISFLCRLVHLRTAGISQSHGAGHLIKGLSRRIVHGAANDLKFPVILHDHQMGMSAGDDQTHKGRLQIRMLDKIGRNVAFDMVDAHQGLFRRVGDGLGLCHSHQKSAHKTGTIGHSNGRHLLQGHGRLL